MAVNKFIKYTEDSNLLVGNFIGTITLGTVTIADLTVTTSFDTVEVVSSGAGTFTVNSANALVVETAANVDVLRVDTVAPLIDVDALLEWGTGRAITAANYQIGRDADATNQLHFNVPTGAGFEWSVNDAATLTLTRGTADSFLTA